MSWWKRCVLCAACCVLRRPCWGGMVLFSRARLALCRCQCRWEDSSLKRVCAAALLDEVDALAMLKEVASAVWVGGRAVA